MTREGWGLKCRLRVPLKQQRGICGLEPVSFFCLPHKSSQGHDTTAHTYIVIVPGDVSPRVLCAVVAV